MMKTVELEVGCNAIIQKSIKKKSRDPNSFTIPMTIGRLLMGRALLDLGASVDHMPLSMIKRIGEIEIRPTRMALQLADRTIKHPYGITEDVLVKVDKVMIDVDDGKLIVRVQGDEVQFNVFEAIKHPKDKGECFQMDVLDEVISYSKKYIEGKDGLEKTLNEVFEEMSDVEAKKNSECLQQLNAFR